MTSHLSDFDPDEREAMGKPPFAAAREGNRACPSPSVLRAAGMGLLPAPLAARVEQHVAACGLCRQLARDLAELPDVEVEPGEAASIDAAVRARTRRSPRALVWRGMAAAAMVAVAAGAAFLAREARLDVRTPAVAAPPSTPAAARAVRPSPLVAVKLPAPPEAGVLVWRGAPVDEYEVALADALRPYSENDFPRAARELERLTGRFPSRPDGWLYLGVTSLLRDDPARAVPALERAVALATGAKQTDAQWYLAIAERQAGRPADALAIVGQLCQTDNPYRAQACLAERELAR